MTANEYAGDLAAIARIDAIPTILEVVCRTTGMGFSAVARVTEDRWIACAVRDEIEFGLQPGGELQVATTLCDEIRKNGQAVVIDHVAEDAVYCGHPTPRQYGFQSYISMPIFRPDGRFFGTLCAIDPHPFCVNTPQTVGMFRLFADLIALHLDAQERLAASEAALRDERETAELREQFIAVLGHDLRNPLNSIHLGARVLLQMPQSEKAAQILTRIQRSAGRIGGLIDNILDFARGRLGGGFSVVRIADSHLATALGQVIAELQAAHPDRLIHTELALPHPVVCDSARVAQLCSNLLANALLHGDPSGPVWLRAHFQDEHFMLSVSNLGEPIPPATTAGLFQPFSRASAQPGRQGLGLGLYMASEIARAHDGTLEVTSSYEETRFTFRMPAVPL